MKVLAAIVTFNRINLLKRCIDNVEKQTRKANNLLIIDNSSTDGTKEFLISKSFNFITQDNTGSAGGWHTAINYAINNNFDAIWLMDDDGFPNINSLNLLISKLDKGFSCVSSILIDDKNHNNLVFPMPNLNKKNLPIIFSNKRKKYNLNEFSSYERKLNEYNFCHLFNGALLSINHIKKIGNVNINYFMFGDEVDYFFRLRSVGKVVTLLNSYHFHPNVSKRPMSNIKLYYYIKNSIILNSKYFDHVYIRNIINIFIGILRFLKRNNLSDNIKFFCYFKFILIFKAIFRGLQSKIEVDYEK